MPTTMRALVLALLLLGVFSTTTADEVQDRRDHAGVRLFRSLLAADLDLPKKTVAANQLLILFLYVDDAKHANDLAKSFIEESKERDKLRGLSIVIEPTNDITFAKYAARVPAGIFIADAPNKS